ncbi:MAG: hypothetical protein ACREHC_08955 [Candidatus Levyibacteriota bacterium]
MNEVSLNDFLLKGRIASDSQRAKGNTEMALHILQITSMIALLNLPKSHPVICSSCKKQLHNGIEVEFYNNVGMCMTCDSVYSDCLTDQMYE